MNLKTWIDQTGVANVAKALEVDDSTVRHWRRGHSKPRTEQMAKINLLTKNKVTYKEMIEADLTPSKGAK